MKAPMCFKYLPKITLTVFLSIGLAACGSSDDEPAPNPAPGGPDTPGPDVSCETPTNFYLDNDGDGYGDDNQVKEACSPETGYVAQAGDCDDNNPNVNPGLSEICDSIDNNCNGDVDEDLTLTTYVKDADGDGYSDPDPATKITSCLAEAPQGYTLTPLGEDCDDNNPSINPGVVSETCDGIDNNCNGEIDEGDGVQTIFYADRDGDGYGTTGTAAEDKITSCELPTGEVSFVANNLDCNDADPAINPSATETCDGADNNCNGEEDEGFTFVNYYPDEDGDGYGTDDDGRAEMIRSCLTEITGYSRHLDDCDDTNAQRNPGLSEICGDGLDNNCDGAIDTGETTSELGTAYYPDIDGDGQGDATAAAIYLCAARENFVANNLDCNDAKTIVNTEADEVCDYIDNNCNGSIDEGTDDAVTYYVDADGDGFRSSTDTETSLFCPGSLPTEGYVALIGDDIIPDLDCDDTRADINDDADEVCDYIDNDCDGSIDEGTDDAVTYYVDADGDGFRSSTDTEVSLFCPDSLPTTGFVAVEDETIPTLDCDDENASIFPDTTEAANGSYVKSCTPLITNNPLGDDWIAQGQFEDITYFTDGTNEYLLFIATQKDDTGTVTHSHIGAASRNSFGEWIIVDLPLYTVTLESDVWFDPTTAIQNLSVLTFNAEVAEGETTPIHRIYFEVSVLEEGIPVDQVAMIQSSDPLNPESWELHPSAVITKATLGASSDVMLDLDLTHLTYDERIDSENKVIGATRLGSDEIATLYLIQSIDGINFSLVGEIGGASSVANIADHALFPYTLAGSSGLDYNYFLLDNLSLGRSVIAKAAIALSTADTSSISFSSAPSLIFSTSEIATRFDSGRIYSFAHHEYADRAELFYIADRALADGETGPTPRVISTATNTRPVITVHNSEELSAGIEADTHLTLYVADTGFGTSEDLSDITFRYEKIAASPSEAIAGSFLCEGDESTITPDDGGEPITIVCSVLATAEGSILEVEIPEILRLANVADEDTTLNMNFYVTDAVGLTGEISISFPIASETTEE